MLNTRGSSRRRGTRTGRIRHRTFAGLLVGGTILGGGVLLAGCSGHSSFTAGIPGSAEPAPAMRPAAGQGTAGNGAGTTARLASAADIVYTAQLTVRAQDVNSAAARAAQIAERVGGYVSNETTSADPDDPSQAAATVQVKIPVASYPATLSQLAGSLGSQLSLQQQAQDVTEQVADVNSQVTSDEAAIAQLRALLSHAGSVSQLLTVQNQINISESGLESMQAEQRALSHETTYATVTVTIYGPRAKAPVRRPKPPPSLAGGLGAGWRALRITVSWILAFLGAAAPFAAIVVLAGYVIYRGRRWVMRRRPAAQSPSPESR